MGVFLLFRAQFILYCFSMEVELHATLTRCLSRLSGEPLTYRK